MARFAVFAVAVAVASRGVSRREMSPPGMVSGTSHAPTRPISWNCGNQETFESATVTPSRARINAQFARTCVTPTTTPFGVPVEPDVNCTNATESSASASSSSSRERERETIASSSSSFIFSFSSRVFSRLPRAPRADTRSSVANASGTASRKDADDRTRVRDARVSAGVVVRVLVTKRNARNARNARPTESNEQASLTEASLNAAAYDSDVNATRAPHAAATSKSAARSSANRGPAAVGSGAR